MANKDLLINAKNLFLNTSNVIDQRVLSQSENLKAEIISLISRIRDLLENLSNIFDSLSKKIGDKIGDKNIISLGKYFYLVFYKDGFILVRTKPFYMILAYDKGMEKASIKSKNLVIDITSSEINMKYIAIKASIKITELEDYKSQYNEIKYILRKFGKIVEQYLLPLVETRLKTI